METVINAANAEIATKGENTLSKMILGKRQTKFDCASVPEIQYQEKTDVSGYESIVKVFEEALMKRLCYQYPEEFKEEMYQKLIQKEREMYNDCLSQTINFLKSIDALKPANKISKIELWRKAVKMTPFYEGVNVQLKSMLIKHHYPEMYEAMSRGAVYSHQSLTNLGEAVLYLMEYFAKKGLLKKQKA